MHVEIVRTTKQSWHPRGVRNGLARQAGQASAAEGHVEVPHVAIVTHLLLRLPRPRDSLPAGQFSFLLVRRQGEASVGHQLTPCVTSDSSSVRVFHKPPRTLFVRTIPNRMHNVRKLNPLPPAPRTRERSRFVGTHRFDAKLLPNLRCSQNEHCNL